jgi:hypothetical protein
MLTLTVLRISENQLPKESQWKQNSMLITGRKWGVEEEADTNFRNPALRKGA